MSIKKSKKSPPREKRKHGGTKVDDPEGYRSRLLKAQEGLGWSRREMADALLTPFSTYEQWLLGRFRTPGVAAIAAEQMLNEQIREARETLARAEQKAKK